MSELLLFYRLWIHSSSFHCAGRPLHSSLGRKHAGPTASHVGGDTTSSSSTAALSYPSLRYHLPSISANKKNKKKKLDFDKEVYERKQCQNRKHCSQLSRRSNSAQCAALIKANHRAHRAYRHLLLHQTSTMHTHCLAFHA